MKKKEIRLLKTVKGHWYFIKNKHFPSGVEMVSSTNILDTAFPNPELNYWKENTSPEEIKEKTENGKRQGTKTHHGCYLLSKGQEINPNVGFSRRQINLLSLETSEDKKKDDELLNYLLNPLTDREYRCLNGFENFWNDFKPITIKRESKVYHKKLLYAGTLDWCGYLLNKKTNKYEFWIIDYKISNNHSRSYEAQICSYHKALCSVEGRSIKARLGLLYLGKTTKKKYQLKEIEDKKRAWNDFILAKKMWHSLNPNAKPTIKEKFPSIKIDVSFKKKGKVIKFNN
jgi:hypothetical protein